MVMRSGDKTRLLSRDEERVLSAIPREYVTDAKQIRLATRLPEDKLEKILKRLITARLVETSAGPRGDQVYRLTSTGLSHPNASDLRGRHRSYVCPLSQSVFVMCFPQLLMPACSGQGCG